MKGVAASDSLSVAMDGADIRQHVGDHAFFTHESVAYALTPQGHNSEPRRGYQGLSKVDEFRWQQGRLFRKIPMSSPMSSTQTISPSTPLPAAT